MSRGRIEEGFGYRFVTFVSIQSTMSDQECTRVTPAGV